MLITTAPTDSSRLFPPFFIGNRYNVVFTLVLVTPLNLGPSGKYVTSNSVSY